MIVCTYDGAMMVRAKERFYKFEENVGVLELNIPITRQ
jgi:hypothetical protein